MRFQPGQSGNPAGRPPGSRNRKTVALEEAFEEHVEDILKEVVSRAKEGEKSAMRLCMERMLAPKRERPVAIDLPVIEAPADARKAIAVVTAELAEGNLTITEATRLIGLIQRMLRLVAQIAEMEQAERETNEAQLRDQAFHAAVNAHFAQDTKAEARPQAPLTEAPAGTPPLYSPVNSQMQRPDTGLGGANGVSPAGVPGAAEAPPLPQAA